MIITPREKTGVQSGYIWLVTSQDFSTYWKVRASLKHYYNHQIIPSTTCYSSTVFLIACYFCSHSIIKQTVYLNRDGNKFYKIMYS